jgi:hypothetical protein
MSDVEGETNSNLYDQLLGLKPVEDRHVSQIIHAVGQKFVPAGFNREAFRRALEWEIRLMELSARSRYPGLSAQMKHARDVVKTAHRLRSLLEKPDLGWRLRYDAFNDKGENQTNEEGFNLGLERITRIAKRYSQKPDPLLLPDGTPLKTGLGGISLFIAAGIAQIYEDHFKRPARASMPKPADAAGKHAKTESYGPFIRFVLCIFNDLKLFPSNSNGVKPNTIYSALAKRRAVQKPIT